MTKYVITRIKSFSFSDSGCKRNTRFELRKYYDGLTKYDIVSSDVLDIKRYRKMFLDNGVPIYQGRIDEINYNGTTNHYNDLSKPISVQSDKNKVVIGNHNISIKELENYE